MIFSSAGTAWRSGHALTRSLTTRNIACSRAIRAVRRVAIGPCLPFRRGTDLAYVMALPATDDRCTVAMTIAPTPERRNPPGGGLDEVPLRGFEPRFPP